MIANISPSIEQIKFYAQGALSGFETLDLETAAECARCNLESLLGYLEAFDNADNTLAIRLVIGVEPLIEIEGLVRNLQSGD